MSMYTGVDISVHQTVTDYVALTDAVDFVVLKASGSNTGSLYVDSKYAQHAAGLGNRVPVGSYFMNGAGSARAAAEFFVANLHPSADDLLVLDVETIDGYTAWRPTQVVEWVSRVKELRPGVPVYVYMNSSEAGSADWSPVEALGARLWVANYGVNDGTRHDDPGTGTWSSWVIHQYTSRGTVPGVSGDVDLNASLIQPAGTGSAADPQEENDMHVIKVAESGAHYLISSNGFREVNSGTAQALANSTGRPVRTILFGHFWEAVVAINALNRVDSALVGVEELDQLADRIAAGSTV